MADRQVFSWPVHVVDNAAPQTELDDIVRTDEMPRADSMPSPSRVADLKIREKHNAEIDAKTKEARDFCTSEKQVTGYHQDIYTGDE